MLFDCNYNSAIALTEKLREELGGDVTKFSKAKLIKYIKSLVRMCESTKLTSSEVCFLISETRYSATLVGDKRLNSIANTAGMIEASGITEPDKFNQRWLELLAKISKLPEGI
jgi:hypothetical protein